MLQLFVGKQVKYGSTKSATATNGALTPDVLANGAIGVYASQNGTLNLLTNGVTGTGLLDATATGNAAVKNQVDAVFVAEGTATGYKMSQRIPIKNGHLKRVIGYEFDAGSVQFTTIGDAANGLTLPGSVAASDTLNLYVNTNEVNYKNQGFHVSLKKFLKVLTGDSVTNPTIGQVIQEMANRINADTYAAVAATAVTAAAASSYLHLQGKQVNTAFEAVVNGWDDSGDVVISTTANSLARGSQALVKDIEFRSFQFQGYFQERDGIFPREDSRVVASAYDVYDIKFAAKRSANPAVAIADSDSEVMVAFVDGDNDAAGDNQGDFEEVVKAVAAWTADAVGTDVFIDDSALDTA